MGKEYILTEKDIGNYIKVIDLDKYVQITERMIEYFGNIELSQMSYLMIIEDKDIFDYSYNLDLDSYFQQRLHIPVEKYRKERICYIPSEEEIISDSRIMEILNYKKRIWVDYHV